MQDEEIFFTRFSELGNWGSLPVYATEYCMANGSFTLTETETDTETDEMRAEPSGNLYRTLSSMNTFIQLYTS